jgi:hypothetical protein
MELAFANLSLHTQKGNAISKRVESHSRVALFTLHSFLS